MLHPVLKDTKQDLLGRWKAPFHHVVPSELQLFERKDTATYSSNEIFDNRYRFDLSIKRIMHSLGQSIRL